MKTAADNLYLFDLDLNEKQPQKPQRTFPPNQLNEHRGHRHRAGRTVSFDTTDAH